MFNFQYLLKSSLRVLNYQTIRWGRSRKPFWLGIAKSKKFVVPVKKKLSAEEEAELQRLKYQHNNDMNSLYHFIINEGTSDIDNDRNEYEGSAIGNSKLQKKIEKSFAINEIWNAKSAELRAKRLKASAEAEEVKSLSKIELKTDTLKKRNMMIEKIVQEEKVKSLSYITLENLDEAVDTCLNNVVDYNFAIDLNGNKYLGKETIEDVKKITHLKSTTATG